VTKLFVGNLPYKATEADLQAFFEEAGVHVDSVNILRDRFSGEARGFGFVEISDDAAANQAVQACNGRALMGRALVVNEARPPERRERTSGGSRRWRRRTPARFRRQQEPLVGHYKRASWTRPFHAPPNPRQY
jgi:cold-inducible RNA-binding protein